MKKQINTRNLCLSAMFLALAIVLPFITGQIPKFGAMLCPMHIPILLCGFVCSGGWGLVTGFSAVLLRSMIFGMPVFFPTAVSMSFELAAYGFVSGTLYKRLGKSKLAIYASLISSMIIGRIVWGIVQFICMGLDSTKFGFGAFITVGVVNSLAGIIIQLILVPVLVMAFEKTGLLKRGEND